MLYDGVMKVFGGHPWLIVAVTGAALLAACGEAPKPSEASRPPTADFSINVNVEYYDPEESRETEVQPIMAEAPGGTESNATAEIPDATNAPTAAPTKTVSGIQAMVANLNVAQTIEFREKNRMFFPFDSAEIQDEQRTLIQEWGTWLGENPGWALRLEGHADQQGPCLYNRWLGQQRANAARDILVNNGINASRLLTVSFGEDRPAIPGASLAERGQNRRVRAVPMKPADLESYNPGIPPCAPAGTA